ncbi:hypothetical protein GOP47_0023624 [Adiantum capillus-veneris]|uniref:Uncharacterized protein n=1 Tax=Adiantum capillus-veneris TaxID=13818 RepID=A0A9D4Z4M5_ADICA|nr:hypothetical protein GOP47_0023624 [Adiantum capillus-veneris]
MAKSGSSSRFVSVNLSKSYGQPSSSSPGHGSGVSSVSGSSSSGYRARLQSGHSGMVVLSRPGRSQPSASSMNSRTTKLVIPRPVNLPSLRREHAGNDPTVPLVGMPGSTGWSKQQVMAPSGDSMADSQSILADSAAVGSRSMTSESSWNFPLSQAKAIASPDGENMEQKAPFYHSGASSSQAPSAKSSLYIPPSSRNSNALNSHPIQHAQPSEKAMVVRGEDFPTLQAAVRPLSVPALQRQRDLQQKQRDKQHELKGQHVKLQQLSQQQNTKVDVLQVKQYAGPPLQPSRPQHTLPKQPSIAEGLPYDAHRAAEKVTNRFNGPSPLIRLTHTSNWGDDERETLQSANTQGLMQSDRLETGRPRNGYHLVDSWALDHKVDTDTGRPTSRNGSVSHFGRGHRDLRDNNRNGGFVSEGSSTQDMNFSNGAIKGLSGQQFDVDSWEDITSWGRGPARTAPSKQDRGYSPKEVISNRDARIGNLSSSSDSKNMGSMRDMHLSSHRDVDPSHRGDRLGTNRFTRDARSRDGNRLDVNSSKLGVDDRQGGRIRKSGGGYQYGRSDVSSAGRVHTGARSDLLGLDYGRDRRVSTLYGQDPFTDEPRSFKSSQSLVFEAFVDSSGFEAKITKRKKDELSSFHDPAREHFEAELERVQKMQEQERQRLVEERERAMELARKEEEERERLAREEELLRLKLEQEAREAAAQAQREQEEVARKADETRRAREEQKNTIMLEEERRKEAARRKLLELEQRIALRESGRVASTGFFERERTEDGVRRGEHRGLQRLDKLNKNEDLVLSRGAMSLQSPVKREFMDGSRLNPLLVNSGRQLSDSRGENRAIQLTRGETLDDGSGLHSAMRNYHHLDIPSHELDHRSFSLQEMSTGPNRSFPVGPLQNSSPAYGQERNFSGSISRKEHGQSGYGDRFLGGDRSSTPLSMDINKGYVDSELERDSDGSWGRDRHGKFQEGQRLHSPPLFSYSNGGENDFSSFSRRRLSLPKQPKVPPPIFGRPVSHRQSVQSESEQAVSPMHTTNHSQNVRKDGANFSGQEMTLKGTSEKGDYVHRPLIEVPTRERPVSDTIEPPKPTTELLDETAEGFGDISQTCKDAVPEPDEIDQFSEQLSDLTESEEQSREDEKHAAVDTEASEVVAYVDEDGDWKDMDEETCVKETEAVQADLDEQEWDNSKTHKYPKSSLEQGTEQEIDESTWESQHAEEQGSLVDDAKGPADSDGRRDQLLVPSTTGIQDEKHEERELETLGPWEVVKGGLIEMQNNLSSGGVLKNLQVGQSEGHHHGHSFIQHFQQPFSFMAVPLPQSTTMNGIPLHPPMLQSKPGPQTQQDIPYPLQMGLFPSTPLMPNAIQIGSIQMPLQVHPQMPPTAHHHQQPPVFQFGQICQFSQPVPPMQPAFQMHHALGQPLLTQHHQADFFCPKESSQLSTVNDIHSSYSSIVAVSGSADSFLDAALVSKDHVDQNSDACLDTSVGKITGGRRRTSNARSNGVYGRGRGRTNGPYSVAEALPESPGKEAPRNRTNRQNICRAEYKIRKLSVTSEKGSELGLDEEVHDVPYDNKHNDSVCGLDGASRSATDDTSDSSFYSQSFGGTRSQLTKSAPRLQAVQAGFKTTQVDAGQARIRSASHQAKGKLTKLKLDELGDTASQGGADFDFEQQGSGVYNDKDDFTEVRSKRNLLREQREMRDKAKIEELKVKEQIVTKQQKVFGKESMLSSGQNPAGRWSVPNADVGKNDGRVGKYLTSVIGSNLQQPGVIPNSTVVSGAAADEPKVSKASQYQSVAVGAHADTQVFLHGYSNDSTPTINAAWGVQRSSHEVVSLTQIQLEEAVSPFGCGISSQKAAISDRSPTSLEPGTLLASGSLSKLSAPVKAPVSMPGPLSSLLAGEKIQFGAVTSPTVISSSSHPPSPFIGAIGWQFGLDKANFSSHHLSLARNCFRQDCKDTFLPSKATPRVEDDVNGQLVDSEAEAMAAASAVAVAAISNDEAVNMYNDANAARGGGEPVGTFSSFSKSPGLDGTRAGIIQTQSKNSEVDNAIAVALPADLSLETTSAPPQPSVPLYSVASEIMPQHLPSRGSSFPMGTIMGGPVFAYGPREDAAFASFESGFAGLGAGSVGGWQHRLSNTSDSFYGAPLPFMSPAGLPSMQGHPHMLVYTNPFTPVGQFGQLGVSFMGTTYHPSGKQPDWTHTPHSASPASMNQSGEDVNAGKPPASDMQHSVLASNSPQAISAAGCSMMPVPAPINVFDPNFTSPFQRSALLYLLCFSIADSRIEEGGRTSAERRRVLDLFFISKREFVVVLPFDSRWIAEERLWIGKIYLREGQCSQPKNTPCTCCHNQEFNVPHLFSPPLL